MTAPAITIGPVSSLNISAAPAGAGYDISFTNFSSANAQSFKSAVGNNTIIYNIARTGSNPTLSASDFAFIQTLNVRASYVAAKLHAGKIRIDTGVIAEPATIGLFGLSLASLAAPPSGGLITRFRRG